MAKPRGERDKCFSYCRLAKIDSGSEVQKILLGDVNYIFCV